jgi:hypothetical protein
LTDELYQQISSGFRNRWKWTYKQISLDKRNELTNKAAQFKADANAIKDEHTHISVHLSSDKRYIDELTHRLVHLI